MKRGALGLAVALACSGKAAPPDASAVVGGDAASAADTAVRELSCAWFTGDNCWKQALRSAAACLPGPETLGQLAGDGALCRYPGGAVVSFRPPLPSPTRWDPGHLPVPQAFEVGGGRPCLSFEQTGGAFTITTAAGSVRRSASTDPVAFACPDGTRWSWPAGLDIRSCGGVPPAMFWQTFVPAPGVTGRIEARLIGGETGDPWAYRCEVNLPAPDGGPGDARRPSDARGCDPADITVESCPLRIWDFYYWDGQGCVAGCNCTRGCQGNVYVVPGNPGASYDACMAAHAGCK